MTKGREAHSVLAGVPFIASASGDNPKLTNIAGYAAVGGIFFLISTLRLGRATHVAKNTDDTAIRAAN